MPAAISLSSPRSSPRMKRTNAASEYTLSTPNSGSKVKKTGLLADTEGAKLNGITEADSPPISRKRIKKETAVVKDNPNSPLKTESQVQGANLTPVLTPRKRKVKIEQIGEEIGDNGDTPKSAKRRKATNVQESDTLNGNTFAEKAKRETAKEVRDEVEAPTSSPNPQKRKPKNPKTVKRADIEEEGELAPKPTKRPRKTAEQRAAEAMPLADRTSSLRMFIGAHVSSAKGVHNTIPNSLHIGANSFAMFLKSQRKWENPPLQNDHRDQFIASCNHYKYDATSHILPHGSYLVNLAQEEPEKAKQAYDAFLDDLQRCEALGIKLYNFHPGSTGSHPRPSAIARIASALNRAHLATKTVTPVLETMAGGGNVVGSTFEDLRDIIAKVDNKTRIGVCLDTCHIFAGGYDLRTPSAFNQTLDAFDKIVGIKYLRALHLNDSKAPFGSHRDLHQNIGLGFLGLRAFHNVMNEPRFEGLPMVLETPIDRKDAGTGKEVEDKGIWAREIKMLEGLIGVDAESEAFRIREKELAEEGEVERKKLQEVFDRKVEKDRKALEKGQQKLYFGGRKKVENEGSDSEGR
ncbi:hypothetical protein MMC21_000986 [Puttea exsequens]|nr:hypothetical protein [Puttea exsequens]